VNRRTFIRATGATSLELASRLGFANTGESVAALLKLLEDSPRESLPRELARRIGGGARYEDVLAALTLASVRNVQPYPDVGFKYHSVMMLRSVHATAQHLPPEDKWLPVLWAADYFKDTQAQERAADGWRQPARPARRVGDAQRSRRALVAALDHWDRDAADAAMAEYARSASADEIFSLLFPYGARDLRAIGHKAIAVSNAHLLTALLGSAQAEPLLRSTVAALLNSDQDRNPSGQDLAPDRPWRVNRQRLEQIPKGWKQGHDDPGARKELRAALYQTSPEEAGGVVVGFLRREVAPEAIWQTLFDVAAELIMHQPGIVPLHAQTTANALHYAYGLCTDEPTQQQLLLQCAAFISMFHQMTGAARGDLELAALEPLPLEHTGADAVTEIFSELAARLRLQAARKCLGYLQGGGDAQAVIATARHHLVYGAEEAHDYKFSEAVFENLAQSPHSAWGARFLCSGMGYFKAPAHRPTETIEEARELLRSSG
jgi:hypothetical protein